MGSSGSHSPKPRSRRTASTDREQHTVESVAADAAILQETPATQMSPRGEFFLTLILSAIFSLRTGRSPDDGSP